MLTLKKSLGQHFLTDESVSQRIVEILQQRPLKNVVEIGPGGGALTKYLAQIPGITLRCIEIDEEKVRFLSKNFPQITVIHADILDTPMPFSETFTAVGNFPYNISTQIIFRILEWKSSVETMIGMF